MNKLAILSLVMMGFVLSAASKYPVFEITCSKGKTAKVCIDQTVTLKAQMVDAANHKESYNQVLQHPMMDNPFEELQQEYTAISQNMGQINVLSKKGVSCPKTHPKVELKGNFSLYESQCSDAEAPQENVKGAQQEQTDDLAGSRKCDYSSYVIRVTSFQCLKK